MKQRRLQKSRWKRFGLRSLLVILVIVSIAGALFANFHAKTRREQSVLDSFGGMYYVTYDYQFDEGGNQNMNASAPAPVWVQNIFGKNAFARVKKLQLVADNDSRGLGRLKNLEELEILIIDAVHDIDNLTSISAPDKLDDMSIISCNSLESLRGIERVSNLKSLSILYCRSLINFNSLQKLSTLETLFLLDCPAATGDFRIKGLESLQEISLNFLSSKKIQILDHPKLCEVKITTSQLTELDIQDCQNLNLVIVDNCPALKRLSNMQGNVRIEELEISNCQQLQDITGLSSLTNLETLRLNSVGISDLDALSKLKNLKHLTVFSAPQLTDIRGIRGLPKLESLELENVSSLKRLDGISDLPALQRVDIVNCNQLTDLEFGGNLNSLEEFSLTSPDNQKFEFPKIKTIKGLESAANLKKLKLHLDVNEDGMTPTIDGLNQLKNLERLWIWGNNEISTLAGLNSTKIQEICLAFNQCEQIDFGSLNLDTLILDRCKIVNMEGIAKLKGLKKLEIRECRGLKDVSALKFLQQLRDLQITNVPKLSDLTSLGELTNLEFLYLRYLPNIESVQFARQLKNLKRFFINECAKIPITELQTLRKQVNKKRAAQTKN